MLKLNEFYCTQGLCGTFNLNQKDDFLTPENDIEQSALAFANKWKTREFCSDIDLKEPEHPCKAKIENKETAEKYCSQLKSKLFECKYCIWTKNLAVKIIFIYIVRYSLY